MTDRRDVIFVTVDSLRADSCGFMGADESPTPALDRLAEDGLVFETAIAPAPATNTSVATMLTGHYPNPSVASDGTDYTDNIRHHMQARRTIANRFNEQGYTTGAFTANPWTSRYFNYDSGFDHFEDFMDESLSSGLVAGGSDKRGVVGEVVSLVLNWYQGQNMFMSWDAFIEDIEAWLSAVDSPYFLWVFLVDAHMPYLPPASYRTRSLALGYPANAALFAGRQFASARAAISPILVDSYRDSIAYTDAFIDRLVSVVDDPLIAVCADHGEAFGEGGVYGHGPAVSEEMTHVPFVIGNGPSDRIERPISLRKLPELLPALARQSTSRALYHVNGLDAKLRPGCGYSRPRLALFVAAERGQCRRYLGGRVGIGR
ncbi:MAG: sulfatase [Natrialbaceae archaeon]|nr:sulfatase [Natrialbaceae archaeon]